MATYLINSATLDVTAHALVSEATADEVVVTSADDLQQFTLAQLRTILGAKPATKGKAVEKVWEMLEAIIPTPAAPTAVATAVAPAPAPAKRKAKRKHRLAGQSLIWTGKTTSRMTSGTVLYVLTEGASFGLSFEDLKAYFASNYIHTDGRRGTEAEATPHINWAELNGFLRIVR